MAYDVGTAVLHVVPSFSKIERELKNLSDRLGKDLSKATGPQVGDAVAKSVKEAAAHSQRESEAAGERLGKSMAGHFADSFARRLGNALRALPKLDITDASSSVDRAVSKVRKDLESLQGKKLGIDIDPAEAIRQARELRKRLAAIRADTDDDRLKVDLAEASDEIQAWVRVAAAGGERLAQEARRSAEEWARVHQSALDENLRRERKAAEDLRKVSAEQGRNHRKALDDALRSTLQARAEVSRAHAQAMNESAAGLRKAYAEQAGSHRKALDDALRRTLQARAEVSRLHAQAIDEDFKRAREADREMGRLHQQAVLEDHKRTRRLAQEAARAAESAFGKTWAGRIQKSIGEAFTSLPDQGMRPARNAAEQLVKDIRGQLDTLRNQRIGIDIDAKTALAQLAELRAQLVNLARTSPNVQVQADVAAAAAQLVLIDKLADRLNRRKIDLRIDADASKLNQVSQAANHTLSRLESLVFIGLSLGTAIVPVAATAAASIGFIGTAAVASAAGVGVLVLAFNGIGTAVGALNKYQEDAQKSSVAIAAAQTRVASATDSVASATRSLANTRASAAAAARRAAEQVVDAQRAVGEARRQAGEAVADAADRASGAERDYARAQVDARAAREGLTRAYRDAVEALEDLDSSVKRNALDQREATLELKEAREELNRILLNPRATDEEREQARITYERRLLQIEDLRRQGKRLAEEQTEANRKGVAGSEQVVSARERIAQADERVSASQKALADARAGVLRAQIDGARRIADAERAVTRARESQAEQQRSSSAQIVQGQQSVISAQRQLQQAMKASGVAGGEALSNLETAMAKLTPTGQRFARFIFGLKDEFDGLRATAADNLLPGVQRAIELMLPYLPPLRTYIGQVASAIGRMFVETAKFLKTDSVWQRFFRHVGSDTVPTLERLGRILRNTVTGLLGLYLAFVPFNDDVGGGLEDLTARFAKWSAELETNQGFQKLLAYIRENGPRVIDLVGQLTNFVTHFVAAVAPIGTIVVQALDALFTKINQIPLPYLQALLGVLGVLALLILAVNTATRFWALTTGTIKKVAGAYTTVQTAAQSMSTGVGTSMDRARDKSDRFARGMDRVKLAGLNMRGGLSSLGAFLGGPWGVALLGATLAVGYFAKKSAEQKQKVTDLAAALKLLGEAYKQTRSISSAAVRDVVAQSVELQNLINNANTYGVAIEDIARAAAGEKAAQDAVVGSLQAKKRAIQEAMVAEIAAGAESGIASHARDEEYKGINTLIAALQSQFGELNRATGAQQALEKAQRDSKATADPLAEAQKAVGEAMAVLADETATAADKANALKRAQDALTGSAKSQMEAEEAYEAAIDNLTGALTEKNNSLDKTTAAGRANRDMVRAQLDASVDLFNAEIAGGMPMDEATRRHNERVTALRKEADATKANKADVEKLIATYGKLPTDIETLLSLSGDVNVDKKLAELAIRQKALEKGIPLAESKRLYEKDKKLAMMATGGLLRGPGTKTSDSILLRGSKGEFMQQASAVDYYGVDLMQALNQRRIPREALPGFAKGGLLQRWPFRVDVSKTQIPDMAPAISAGGIGSLDMMRLLRRIFPGLPLFSGFRKGARTQSGSRSYHSMYAKDGDEGRAVDLPPRKDVFDYIHNNYFSGTRELIWAGDPNRNIWNGKHHRYSAGLLANHGVAGQPNAHVHWAYDSGGMLPPGVSTVVNATGKPEPVLTAPQWDQVAALVRNNHAERRGVENHYHFLKADLDINRLQAIQARQDALVRAGRPQ